VTNIVSECLTKAWSASPIDLEAYFHDWATIRYSDSNTTSGPLPAQIYETWEILLRTVYNNTNLTSAQAVTKSIFELAPNATGLVNRTGHHPTTITYDPSTLVEAWQTFISASNSTPALWSNKAYQFDLIDISRQVLANTFNPLYSAFIAQTNLTNLDTTNKSTRNASIAAATQTQSQMLSLLTTIDTLVQFTPSKSPESSLPAWISTARSWADGNATISDFYAYNAINQVTLWGPMGEISDYASRQWAGLVGGYYLPRWQIFTDAYLDALKTGHAVNQTQLHAGLLSWEEQQQEPLASVGTSLQPSDGLQNKINLIESEWCEVLGC